MSALYDALASGLGRRVDEGGAAGGVVSVLEHGKMRTRTLGAGWEDAVRGEPEAPIYSVTKTFLAVLVLRLFRETGRSLDVPAAHWHGDIPGADRFSVRQLLNHTAGVRDYGPLAEYHRAVARQPGEPWSRGEFAKHTWLRGLSGDPGERFAYANPGYRLLAEIAEAESGLALGAALERHVLEPASIGHTRVVTRVEDLAGSAPADSRVLDPDGRLVDARTYHPGWVFHGLLVSRASSVAQFLDLVATGALLHPEDRSALLDCVPVAAEHPRLVPGYGLGVMADSRAPEACFGHDGGGPGFTAAAWHLNGEAGVASVCVILASEADHAAESLLFETATEAGFAPPTPASSS